MSYYFSLFIEFVANVFVDHCLSTKWDGDLNAIKSKVKDDIEEMVSHWSREQKDSCVNETAAAFRGGGAVNSYLSGGRSPH